MGVIPPRLQNYEIRTLTRHGGISGVIPLRRYNKRYVR